MIALLSDIHSNIQALDACLDDALGIGTRQFVFLGDFVGYGGNPDLVLTRIQDLVAQGALALKGNHDDMAADFDRDMNETAAQAANWTRRQLTPEQLAFLDALPMTITQDDRFYVHGDASEPEKWRYVTDRRSALVSLQAVPHRIVISGHVHLPAIYGLASDGTISKFIPDGEAEVPLLTSRRWQVVLPSVGQPRDGNPLAGYGLYDPATHLLQFRRLAYDIDAAAAAIQAAGLPQRLATRLYMGR
ncbi:metallophosphoesterase family protein [Candidatus Phycosocius spiralis]|uniref:Metallophosphoesterase n=1 Tax=Candidatus Phycosocius spiralis TaxID=2815099 RepID=A0ABQ4PSU3_9PROT|nr:metallophosphoesterase family protein [Candidatus Phycosocius spiralis]GIU66060.1 metallophosphoesterase [Candidatus Phycosocius spiralis]